MDGSYPLTRTLYLYINKKPSERLSPALSEFLRFVNSRQGQEIVVKAGVYALPPVDIHKNSEELHRHSDRSQKISGNQNQ